MRKKYASKLKVASKLHDLKMRRFMAAVDSNRGSTTNQLERYHEANTELLEAKFIHAGVQAKVAEQERDAYTVGPWRPPWRVVSLACWTSVHCPVTELVEQVARVGYRDRA